MVLTLYYYTSRKGYWTLRRNGYLESTTEYDMTTGTKTIHPYVYLTDLPPDCDGGRIALARHLFRKPDINVVKRGQLTHCLAFEVAPNQVTRLDSHLYCFTGGYYGSGFGDGRNRYLHLRRPRSKGYWKRVAARAFLPFRVVAGLALTRFYVMLFVFFIRQLDRPYRLERQKEEKKRRREQREYQKWEKEQKRQRALEEKKKKKMERQEARKNKVPRRVVVPLPNEQNDSDEISETTIPRDIAVVPGTMTTHVPRHEHVRPRTGRQASNNVLGTTYTRGDGDDDSTSIVSECASLLLLLVVMLTPLVILECTKQETFSL